MKYLKSGAHAIICLEFIWRFHALVMSVVFTVIFPIHIGKVQCHGTYSLEFLHSA